jgi:hypothetical protein
MPSLATRWTTRTLAACMIGTAVASPLALAQEAGDKPKQSEQSTFSGGPVLVIDHAELSKFFPDAKDQGLLKAFQMLPQRIRELPGEIDKEDFTAEHAAVISSIMQALSRPGRISVMYDESPTGGLFGYGVAFSVQTKDKAEADDLEAKIKGLLAQANEQLRFKPSSRFQGMSELQLPFGLLSVGPREATDGWRYEIILGTMQAPDAAAESLPAPDKGFTPLVRAYFNTRGLLPALDMAKNMAGPNLPPQAAGIEDMIQNGLAMTYEAGFTKDAMVSRSIVRAAKPAADRLMIGTKALSASDIRIFPADTGIGYMRRLTEGWAANMLESIASQAPQADEHLEHFKEHTGVDLRDFAASLGDTVAFFTSETTGGGGLGSAVALISIADRAKLTDSLGKLANVANAAAEHEARGYVRIATHEESGTTFYMLQFPGLPVPFEFTMALTDKWFVVAPIPQGAVAAVKHIAGKAEGLVGVPAFKSLGNREQMVEFSYVDSARSLRSGYTLLSLAGSAVSNMVRSPSDASRDTGLVIPLYQELASGMVPAVKTTYWRGDDLVSESYASHSMVANIGASLGVVSKILPFVAAAGAAAAAQKNDWTMTDDGTLPIRALGVLSLPTPERLALRAALAASAEPNAEAALITTLLDATEAAR